jgi:hypothetical protein
MVFAPLPKSGSGHVDMIFQRLSPLAILPCPRWSENINGFVIKDRENVIYDN